MTFFYDCGFTVFSLQLNLIYTFIEFTLVNFLLLLFSFVCSNFSLQLQKTYVFKTVENVHF